VAGPGTLPTTTDPAVTTTTVAGPGELPETGGSGGFSPLAMVLGGLGLLFIGGGLQVMAANRERYPRVI